MKNTFSFATFVFIVVFSFGFVSAANAQDAKAPVPVIAVPQSRSIVNVYKRYTTVKKMNGVDSNARKDIVALKSDVAEIKKQLDGKADSNAVIEGFKAVDERFAANDAVNGRQDRELGYTFWAFILIPLAFLILAAILFRNANGGANATATATTAAADSATPPTANGGEQASLSAVNRVGYPYGGPVYVDSFNTTVYSADRYSEDYYSNHTPDSRNNQGRRTSGQTPPSAE